MESSTKLPEISERKISVRDNIIIACFFFSILFAGFILDPTTESVSFLGWRVPEICASKILLGIDCLGCGLTRSVSFTMHGKLSQAWEMNLLGIPLTFVFAFIGLRCLYRLIHLKS